MSDYIILTWIDYLIIIITLSLSTVVGSYFGFVKKKSQHNRAKEYMDGGHNLQVLPVTISICASTISSIGFLGVVAEIFEYGMHHFIGSTVTMLGVLFPMYIYLPVFHKLQLTSMYEYLEVRFGRKIRTLASVLFILESIMYPGIVTYCSSVALAKMSGIQLHYVNAISCAICIFYTMLGGLKGVIWTDTLQAWIMLGSMGSIIVLATINVGGVSEVVRIVTEMHHLDLEFTLNPFIRTSVLMACTGQWWYNVHSIFLNQSNIQRFNAIPKYEDAKKASFLVGVGCFLLLVFSSICGVVLFAVYAYCNPLATHQIRKTEEILPKFILDYTLHIPGFAGVFLAGLLSAGLSTMSAKLNSAAAVIYSDFITPFYKKSISDLAATRLLKTLVVVIGVCCFCFGFIIDMLGQIIQVCVTFQSMCYGTLAGLFILGMLVPQCNVKGAYVGGIVSAVTICAIAFGNSWAIANGTLKYPKLPTSTEGCNMTEIPELILTEIMEDKAEPFILFQLSFMAYSFLGTIITIVVGYIVSYITGFQDLMKVNPDHITPCLQNWLKKKQKLVKCQPSDVEMKLLQKQININS